MDNTQNEMNKSIGRKIKYLRQIYGESREELAKSIGVSFDTLKKYEQGQRNPSDDVRALIANRYGLDKIEYAADPLKDEVVSPATFGRGVDDLLEDSAHMLFPVFYSEDMSLSDPMKKAVYRHQMLMNDLSTCGTAKDINLCLKLYRESIQGDDDEAVSVANRISLLMLGEYGNAMSRALCGVEDLRAESYRDLFRINAKIKGRLQAELDGVSEKKKDHIQELIEKLYGHPLTRFSEIGHYFTALSVCLGFSQYVEGVSAREAVGLSMMLAIGIAGNAYATDYLIIALGPLLEDD